MTMLTEYERRQLAAIEAWKNAEPGVLSRAFGVVVAPVEWIVQTVVPEVVVRNAIDGASKLARFMTDTEDVLRAAQVSSVAALRSKELSLCDRLADDVHNLAIAIAVAEGSTTGAMGIVSAPIDVPAIITVAMRTIHKIGICYGYECKTDEDEQFYRGILAAAGATTLEEKAVALGALTTIRVVLVRQTWKAMAKSITQHQLGRGMITVTAYDLVKQIGISLIRHRALAAIPVIGAIVGGSANGWYIKAVGWAARRSFQERWLADAGKLTPDEKIN
jgi:hypothetical protein